MGITRRDFLRVAGVAGGVLVGVGNVKHAAGGEIPEATSTERKYKTFKEFAVSNYASKKDVEVGRTGSAGAFEHYESEGDDGISVKEDFYIRGLKQDVTIDTVIRDADSFFSEQGFKIVGGYPEGGTLVMDRESGKIRERYNVTIGLYKGKTPENRRLEFVLISLMTVYS